MFNYIINTVLGSCIVSQQSYEVNIFNLIFLLYQWRKWDAVVTPKSQQSLYIAELGVGSG